MKFLGKETILFCFCLGQDVNRYPSGMQLDILKVFRAQSPKTKYFERFFSFNKHLYSNGTDVKENCLQLTIAFEKFSDFKFSTLICVYKRFGVYQSLLILFLWLNIMKTNCFIKVFKSYHFFNKNFGLIFLH